ncbi:MAG: hypothetical protein LBU22_11615 [Dysgonamonadaceae bacterium]|nr:hypothetical protein [Dysgonamonadaceae bacterium]
MRLTIVQEVSPLRFASVDRTFRLMGKKRERDRTGGFAAGSIPFLLFFQLTRLSTKRAK